MKGKTHTAGQGEVGHARADGWMSGARTWAAGQGEDGHARADGWMSGARMGGGVDEWGTHLGGGAEAEMGTHFEKP